MVIRQYILSTYKSFCVRKDYQKDIYIQICNLHETYDYIYNRNVYCNKLKTVPHKMLEKYNKFRMYYTLSCSMQIPIRKIELTLHEW